MYGVDTCRPRERYECERLSNMSIYNDGWSEWGAIESYCKHSRLILTTMCHFNITLETENKKKKNLKKTHAEWHAVPWNVQRRDTIIMFDSDDDKDDDDFYFIHSNSWMSLNCGISYVWLPHLRTKKKKNKKISSSAATETGRNNISDNSRWRSHTAYHMPHIIINNRRECRVISLLLDSFMHQNNVHSHCECDNRPKRCTPQWPNQASQITFIICSS